MALDILECGKVINVIGFYHIDLANQLSKLFIKFQNTGLLIHVNEDDDSIHFDMINEVSKNHEKDHHTHSISKQNIWSKTLGKKIRWMWLMENDQGYEDGIEF